MRLVLLSNRFLTSIQDNPADHLSRKWAVNHEWALNESVFQQILFKWYFPLKTLFLLVAQKCQLFWSSGSMSLGFLLDAFLNSWKGDLIYAFPLIPLLPRVLRKVRQNKTLLILIATEWV